MTALEPTNLAAWQKALQQAADQLQAETEQQLLALAFTVQNEARRRCPVDTGRLRASITNSGLQRDSRGTYVDVGTNVFYAGFVEFGTRRAAAQPYLRPALLAAAASWGKG